MFAILIIWALAFLPFLNAMPTTPLSQPALQKRCTNVLKNPSFESGVSPWLEMGFGSWSARGVYTQASGGHDGNNFYWAHSNATVSESSMSLSQSGLSLPAETTIDCSVWVASRRPGNIESTEITVMLDGVTCGSAIHLGTTGWVKVGGKVTVSGGVDSHTFTVVAISGTTGPEGSQVWIDDAMVGTGC